MVTKSLRKAFPVLLILISAFTPSDAGPRDVSTTGSSYAWTRVRGWGAGAFQESWRQGQVPLALKPHVGPEGKLWIFGGSAAGVAGDETWLNDVWTISPGKRWVRENPHAPWSRRAPQYSVVFKDRIWLYGGKGIEANGRGGFADDMWSFGKTSQ